MLLTAVTIVFIYVCLKRKKQDNEVKFFLPMLVFLIGVYALAVIPMSLLLGWFFGAIIAGTALVLVLLNKKGKINVVSATQYTALLCSLLTICIYTQFFNGLETFYANPRRFFQYSAGITAKYFLVPPKIISIKSTERDYVYSLTQYKNAFFFPESLTQIEMYEGVPCYYWANWKLGNVPIYYRRYFDQTFIDSPA